MSTTYTSTVNGESFTAFYSGQTTGGVGPAIQFMNRRSGMEILAQALKGVPFESEAGFNIAQPELALILTTRAWTFYE